MSISIIRPAHVFLFTCDSCGDKCEVTAETEQKARSNISCEYPCWRTDAVRVTCNTCEHNRKAEQEELAEYNRLKEKFGRPKAKP